MWDTAHVEVEANEVVDKQALNHTEIAIPVTPIKYEVKGKIKEIINNKCQEVWNCDRHIYNIEQQVGNVRSVFRNRKEDTIINHIHIVHCVY